MTNIKFFKSKNENYFVGFVCSGHTGFDESGKDVLCATISGITQSIVIGLKDVCGIKLKLKRIDKDGYIKVELPKSISLDKLKESQILFETLYKSINDLMEGYSEYISMEVIENVY
ncbi:MAG: ribosomal-processing cysteine protease Prp [Clostridia bacterium]|nr:ribosomal-processing cysteine protease Prp [Clostridia bacterium]